MNDVLLAYLRERFRLKVFGPAATMHAAAALWATGLRPTTGSVALALGVAVGLLLQFRLWDDLEDLERDRVCHPQRVLVRANPAQFRLIGTILAGVNVLIVAARSPIAALGLVGLDLGFLIAYTMLRGSLSDRVWRFHVLLLKYPVFVCLIAAPVGRVLPWRLLVASCVVYLCACTYETLHDRQLPSGVIS
jgi:hypothetical protein